MQPVATIDSNPNQVQCIMFTVLGVVNERIFNYPQPSCVPCAGGHPVGPVRRHVGRQPLHGAAGRLGTVPGRGLGLGQVPRRDLLPAHQLQLLAVPPKLSERILVNPTATEVFWRVRLWPGQLMHSSNDNLYSSARGRTNTGCVTREMVPKQGWCMVRRRLGQLHGMSVRTLSWVRGNQSVEDQHV